MMDKFFFWIIIKNKNWNKDTLSVSLEENKCLIQRSTETVLSLYPSIFFYFFLTKDASMVCSLFRVILKTKRKKEILKQSKVSNTKKKIYLY